jgi:signal transduction histidine kinase
MIFLNSILDSGTTFVDHPSQKRSVHLSNQISLALFILILLLNILYASWYGWVFISEVLPVVVFLCLTPIVFNRFGLTTLSRIWLGLLLSFASTSISIYSKIQYYDSVAELDYFGFRFFLLAGCTLPAILFPFREKRALLFTSLASFGMLMAFDPLHELFGVPYPDLLLKKSSYDFTNIIVAITYCIIVGAIFFLKSVSEESEQKANTLIHELNQINKELAEKNGEIEAQRAELHEQREAHQDNQEKLEKANRLIEEQKDSLFIQNKDLALELIEKNKSLTDTNHELIKHNNELSQFSYTVSHNLRGPVASLLGLIQIMDDHELKPNQDEVNRHLKNSVNKLDTIIRDLSKIIDIRNDIFRIRQKINIAAELDSILLMLKGDQEALDAEFHIDLTRAPVFYSVRPMVVSIIYNLISNALKYRSLERTPVIEITSGLDDHYFMLTVRDNGLGIDLKRHQESMFKMYKRFHPHTEGKGLGLYLIKMQAEALNGRIEVSSQLNTFTEFNVFIGVSENLEEQVLLDEPYSRIFYDAILNSTGVIWRGPVSSGQYRITYLKGIEFLKAYSTPNWITDLAHQGPVDPNDQQWLIKEIIPQAIENGLVRIAAVQPSVLTDDIHQYLKGIEEALLIPGITFRYFSSREEAREWIREENEKAASVKINL